MPRVGSHCSVQSSATLAFQLRSKMLLGGGVGGCRGPLMVPGGERTGGPLTDPLLQVSPPEKTLGTALPLYRRGRAGKGPLGHPEEETPQSSRAESMSWTPSRASRSPTPKRTWRQSWALIGTTPIQTCHGRPGLT